MSGPWEKFQQQQPQEDTGKPWERFAQPAPAPEQPPSKAYKGSVLPFSVDEQGKARFDITAGLPAGMVKGVWDAVTLPRDAMQGKFDPTSDEGISRLLNAGMLMSPVNPAVRAGDAAIPGPIRAMRKEMPAAPSAETLKQTASGQYDAARNMGVDYKAGSVVNMAGTTQRALEADGIFDVTAPKTHAILARLQDAPPGSVASISNLESARRALSTLSAKDADATERMAAGRAVQALSKFVEDADPANVVAGPAAEAASLFKTARGNAGAQLRSDMLTGKQSAAELRAAAANSGQNVGNSVRQRLADALIREKELRGFTPEEIAAVEGVVKGSPAANTTRALSNILGGGGGLGSMAAGTVGGVVGSFLGGPVGTAVGSVGLPAVGWAAKRGSNNMTLKALQNVDEMVRSRSPLYEEMVKNAPMTAINPEGRAALTKFLLMKALQEDEALRKARPLKSGSPALSPYES